jgi:hypothetical protein
MKEMGNDGHITFYQCDRGEALEYGKFHITFERVMAAPIGTQWISNFDFSGHIAVRTKYGVSILWENKEEAVVEWENLNREARARLAELSLRLVAVGS